MGNILQDMTTDIRKSITEHADQWRIDYADNLDWGSCGSAVVLLSFGRKRKLKQAFIDAELVTDDQYWDHMGRKEHLLNIRSIPMPTQSASYYHGQCQAIVDVIKCYFPDEDFVRLHSWID